MLYRRSRRGWVRDGTLLAALLLLAALRLLPASTAWAADTDEDGLEDAAEVSRARDHAFEAHLIVDEFPGDPPPLSGPPSPPSRVALGDLDGDGDADLVASWVLIIGAADETYWYRNRLSEPAADFALESIVATNEVSDLLDLLALDMDGDGDIDVVFESVQGPSPSSLHIAFLWSENRLGEEAGDFAPPQPILGSTPTGPPSAAFALADLDGDEDPDLAWVHNELGLGWYENRLNEPAGDFGPRQGISSHLPVAGFVLQATVLADDVDVDGDMDLLYSTWGDCRIAWHENRIDEVTADFAAARVVASGAEGGIVLGSADLDRNGYPDLLGSTPHASQFQNPCVPEDDGHRLWYPNRLANEGGGFAAAEPISELAAGSVEAADLDGDEDPDLIWELPNGIGSTLAAQQNRLGEEGSAFPPLDVGTIWGSEVASSDLDGDGDLDFIAVSEGPAVVGAVWLENPGTNPDDPDSDGDGFQDGAEVDAASDPNDPDSMPVPEPAAAIGMLAALATLARLRRRSGCRGRAPARASTSCLI